MNINSEYMDKGLCCQKCSILLRNFCKKYLNTVKVELIEELAYSLFLFFFFLFYFVYFLKQDVKLKLP